MGPIAGSGSQRNASAELQPFTAAVPVRGSYDIDYVLGFLAARAVPGVEHVDDRSCTRTARLPSGPSMFTATPSSTQITVTGAIRGTEDAAALLHAVRLTFDTETDGAAIDAALLQLPAFAEPVRRHPGIRVPGRWTLKNC